MHTRFPQLPDLARVIEDARQGIQGAQAKALEQLSRLSAEHSLIDGTGPSIAARAWLDSLANRSIATELFAGRGVGSAGEIGWMLAQDPNWRERDVTARFNQLHDAAKNPKFQLPPNKDDYAYLLVPGLFTERYLGYMTENKRRLEQLGCGVVRKATIDTDASILVNAEDLRKQINALAAETGKEVIVLGHSKGGTDTGTLLERHLDEMKEVVAAFIPLQAPWGGTPIASDVGGDQHLSAFVRRIITDLFEGDPQSFSDLSYASRQALAGNETKFSKVIPTFSFASSSTSAASATRLPQLYIERRYAAKSDGLVPANDAIVPHSAGIVVLEGVDHAAPAIRGPGKYKPGGITAAMVTLALDHLARRPG